MNYRTDGFIRLILVSPFLQHLKKLGVNPAPVLDEMGIDLETLRDPEATAHAEVVYRLCNRLAEAADDPFLGCHIAEQFDIATWPPFKDAGQNSGTVGEFLSNFLLRVPQESSSVRHTFTIGFETSSYAVERLVRTSSRPVQAEGFGIGLQLRILRMAKGKNWNPSGVLVTSPYPEAVPARYMGVRLMKSRGTGLVLSFPSTWISTPIALGGAQLKETDAPPVVDFSVVTALRSAATPLLQNGAVTEEAVAAAIGLSRKNLEQDLRVLQTTPAKEIKRLRVDIAKDGLVNSAQSIAEIGRSLGYADQSHFSRFFRSQTGVSPGVFRKARRID